ncbi:SDR family NAD(P)-dependent oxidoreductase [Bradyrhizobium pachyrhizi]|uniref:SDR family NAD(P)-dependent oxidoreductase n=1 Tax=Bradyrhizobium pachyrhizi TaxID=280333 RepID=UPI003D368CC7
MSDQNRRVAVVTGASRGIGAAIAERLSQDDLMVAINFADNAALAEALAQKIGQTGGSHFLYRADVSDPVSVREMFDAVEARFGGIDVLVNNAGIQNLAPLAEMTDAAFDRMIAVNVKGVFNTLCEAAKRMRRGGRIINLSSGTSALQWIINAYSLAFATLLLTAGVAGDRFGSRRIFLIGLALFGYVSLGCGLAFSAMDVDRRSGDPRGRRGIDFADFAGPDCARE